MKVPFLDLKAQYAQIKDEVAPAITSVMENTAFALGPAVADFEQRFADYCHVKHAVGVNSGTSALHLALLAVGIGPGDEVIVPAMTFLATASAVEYAGAKPVPVDVSPGTWTMDPDKIEAAITPATKAVMPVHLYGQPAPMDAIAAVADKHGLLLLEDAAQAHGAEDNGRRAGSIGRIAGFSFYPGKNLGAYGEGGAVTTNDDELAETVRSLRDWGQRGKGNHELRGFNYRMEGFQGAVLGVKMNYIESWTEGRRAAAARYNERLAGVDGITAPMVRDNVRHVYHIYPVLVADRDAVRDRLNDAGIASGIHYPKPLHLQPCFADWGYGAGDFPVAERVGREELSLPMFPEMTLEQVDLVVDALIDAVK